MSEREQRCETCRFWEAEYPGADWGRCRRRAPHPCTTDDTAYWPRTNDGDWCGEWQPREDKGKDGGR